MRPLNDPIIYTHLLFIVNVALYLHLGYALLGTVLGANGIASYLYHRSKERNRFWRQADHILCVVSLVFIFAYLVSNATWFQVSYCLAWLILSLGVYWLGKTNYAFYHPLWHGFVFGGNVLVWYALGGE